MTRLAEIRRQWTGCKCRAEQVGFLAGLRLDGEWSDTEVQSWIKALPDARALVIEAKAWMEEA